jgi:hypothetical protein
MLLQVHCIYRCDAGMTVTTAAVVDKYDAQFTISRDWLLLLMFTVNVTSGPCTLLLDSRLRCTAREDIS